MRGKDKLTQRQIETARPRAAPFKLVDGGGLYLLVHPNGGKYWRVAYRFDG